MNTTAQRIDAAGAQLTATITDARTEAVEGRSINTLELLTEARQLLTELEQLAAIQARQERHSWEVIADAAGISKQAANKKWSRLTTELPTELPPAFQSAGRPMPSQLQDEATPVDAQPASAADAVQHVPGQQQLPVATELRPWVCGNCGKDTFAQVDTLDPFSWCSRCHAASDPTPYAEGSTCGHCGVGRHERCQFDPRSRTYTTGQPIALAEAEHWQCACSLHHEAQVIAELRPTPTARELELVREHVMVVVACGKMKANTQELARFMYTGQQFTLARDAAVELVSAVRASGRSASWRILSAEHGLINPDAMIHPYERTMDDPNAVSDELVAWQLENDKPSRIVALTPASYTAKLRRARELSGYPLSIDDVLTGLPIGKQRAVLAQLKRLDPAVVGPILPTA